MNNDLRVYWPPSRGVKMALQVFVVFGAFFIGNLAIKGDLETALVTASFIALFYLLVYVLTGKSLLWPDDPIDEDTLKNRGSLGVLASSVFFIIGLIAMSDNILVFSSSIFIGLFTFFSSLGMLLSGSRTMLNMLAAITLLPIPYIFSMYVDDIYIKAVLYLIGLAWLFFVILGAYGIISKKKTMADY